MRRFIFMSLFSILFLCSVAPKVRGYTLVQAASKTGPGVNVVSVSFPKATTAGNLIIVSAGWSNGGTASVSDSKLNTYSTAVGPPASGYASQIWYAANIVGGADTVTVSFNASYNDVVNIFEYSGLASSSPLDATGSNTGNSNSLNTGNITTTQANELIFATGFAVDQLTGGTNYTLEEQAVYGTNEYLGAEDRTGPAGSYQATFSDASSWNWVAQIATFKAAAVTPGTPTCGIHGDASIHVPTDWTTFGPPAKGQSYVDATFGCTVTRITDVSSEIWNPYPSVCNTTNTGCYIPIGHGYSTLSPFNANDTYLMLGDGEGFHFVTDLLGNIVVPGADMSNWTASNGMPQQFNDGWFLWDASDPNVFYYTNGSSMMKGTINGTCTPASTVCTSVVHDFSQDTPSYSAINFMDDADLSQDGAHVVIVAGDTTGTSPENVFVYNFLTNIKGPVYTTTTNPDNSQCVGSVNGPNNSCLHKLNQTADNNVLISFGYEPSTCGQNNPGTDTSGQEGYRLWNGTSPLIGLQNCSSHVDTGYDTSGNSIFLDGTNVYAFPSRTNPCPNQWGALGVRQLNNLSSAGCLLENLPSWHVSYRGSAQQPWVLLSFEDQSACGTPAAPNSPEWFGTSGCYQSPSANWSLYEDEIMLVRIDANNDSSKVYRLARGYSRTDENFNAQLKAAISRDGKYIAFDSNMAFAQSGCPSNFQQNGDGTITNCADVYVVKVR